MKNQYFGDVRDLFKYDLIQQILKEMGSLQRFIFIPMLTKNDPKMGDGNKRDFDRAKRDSRPGTDNRKLMEFLEKYKEKDRDKRDFTEIENYFKSVGFKIIIYKGNEFFEHTARTDYFIEIEKQLLPNSLIFVDPDIGLEVKKSTAKHVLYSEVKGLYDQMDENSIMMIYQHFPRARHKYKEYLPEGRSNKLEKEIGNLPLYISDNEIIFFLLTKNDELRTQLERIIRGYEKDYQKLKITQK